MEFFDIFLLEAVLNGLLLGGLLALLSLGLNLIFGVIDVVWICYAEVVMVGMYGINHAYKAGEQQAVEDRLQEEDVELAVHRTNGVRPLASTLRFFPCRQTRGV